MTLKKKQQRTCRCFPYMRAMQNMEPNMLTFPFEVSLEEVLRDPESYVDSVFSCLESEFLVMPKGAGFVEYPVFESGYEALKAATDGFFMFDPDKV